MLYSLDKKYLLPHIVLGIIVGVILALVAPDIAKATNLLGTLFVGALKAAAPFLVFILIINAIANRSADSTEHMPKIVLLYLVGTVSAATVAVIVAYIGKPELSLLSLDENTLTPPVSLQAVLTNILLKLVQNPVTALAEANFIGVVAWGIILGIFLQRASDTSKQMLTDVATAFTDIVTLVIRFAPLGIMGLVANTVANSGLSVLNEYARLLLVLLSAMAIVALVVNPLLVFFLTKRNPYPLVFTCLKESGLTAFFTRSSAANIPVNMNLCEKLNLDPKLYTVSIPLGAAVNMAGAAITITVMTLAAVNTLGFDMNFSTVLLLCIVASFSACGASGVAGGSLLLIPLACNLFGISSDIAMQVVAVGFIIGVVQDSAETALNSSTDVVFTAACGQPK